MSSLYSYLLTLTVYWPLFIPHTAVAALDEASLSKQLSECVPTLVDQLESARVKIPDCDKILTFCRSVGSRESRVRLHLNCNIHGGPNLATQLSCGGENAKEVLNEFIDRWCFTDVKTSIEVGEDVKNPTRAFVLTKDQFYSEIKKVTAASNPLPDKATLVRFLLNLVKSEIRNNCDLLTIACGDGAAAVTEIQGTECKALALFTKDPNGGKFLSREDLQPKITNPSAMAFLFKLLHPAVRMEKTARVINDLLCSTDKVKKQPFKKMPDFERAIRSVAADYTIA